ncbi:MAG: hypothetical protein ACRDPS_03650 [Nocardioides sp.]|uniref:hypothetical protein n=1 Tax=Nocardioides sp. TaxID=35761 RepID=UPI003D6AC4D4
MKQRERHPIVAGVTALVAVALAVGLIAGIAMFVGANIVGFGGGSEAGDKATDPDAGASLHVPAPVPTETDTGPAITLRASPTASPTTSSKKQGGSASEDASESPSASTAAEKPARKKITLQVGTVQAEPMETISITGIYPGGEGATLRLERRRDGRWQEFGISDVRVTGEQFSTKIQTGRIGKHRFRMKDIDTGAYSNKVSVTIG